MATKTKAEAVVSEDLELDPTDFEEGAEAPEKTEKVEVIRYVGKATRRVISREDWAGVGADDHESSEWNFANSFELPKSDFSPEARAYLQRDGSFIVVIVDKD